MKGKFPMFALVTVVAVAAAVPALAQFEKPLDLGAAPPMADEKMKGIDGKEMSIADVKGEKGTLVLFTCNGCPWVKAWEDRIAELGNAYAAKGIGVIAINANDPAQNEEDGYEVMQKRAAEKGVKYPYVVDSTSEVARAFGASRTPEAFLFDAEGRLVYHGTIDDNADEPDKVEKRYLRDALEAVASGGKVAVQRTKALGCNIKFKATS
ncbi:MAG: thioredoxin family protein [Acidobacteria bacterium]|nr:thioredoxin family protein [Acidobacteriota bacterium]